MATAAPETGRGLSLRLKLSIGLILIIGILFAGANTFNILSHRTSQREEAMVANETVARLVAGALISELGSNDIKSDRIRSFAANFLTAALTLNPKNRDLAFVLVVDNDNQVIVGKAKTQLTQFPGNKTFEDEATVLAEIAKLEGRLGGDMRVNRFPLRVKGTGDVSVDVGRLLVGTSLARIKLEAQRDLYINISVLVAALAILVIYASITLGRLVIKPITSVVTAMRAVQDGDLTHEVNIQRGDEIGVLANTYNFMVRGLREREQLKDAFSRYVSPQVYERFRAGAINLSGELRQATVLFSDIRSFTTLSEQLTPPEVVAMLNEYFTEMVEIVFKNDGFVNKFIGDAIMAIYNVPIDQPDPELRAVRTALQMIEALERFNQRRLARGQFAIKIGVGINTGPVVAGNLGHERRLEYTVIGDAVNLAQRLESQTKVVGSPILISQSTYLACASHIRAQELPPVKVKGKQEQVILYAVQGLRTDKEEIVLPAGLAKPPPPSTALTAATATAVRQMPPPPATPPIAPTRAASGTAPAALNPTLAPVGPTPSATAAPAPAPAPGKTA